MSGYLILGIFVVGLLCVVFDFSISITNTHKNIVFNCMFILLFIIASSKTSSASFDTENYIQYYNNVATLSNLHNATEWYEIGFTLLNMTAKSIGLSYRWVFITTAAISLCLYRRVIKTYCDYPFLALYIYVACFYFINEIIIIRFGVACSIILYNMINIQNNRRIRKWLAVLIGCLFHSAAVVGILPIILSKHIFNQRRLIVITSLSLLLSFVIWILSPSEIINTLANLSIPGLKFRLSKLMLSMQNSSSAGLKRVCLYLPLLLICIYYMFNITGRNSMRETIVFQKYKICYSYLLIAIACMIAFNENSSLARLNSLLLTSNIVTIPLLLKGCKRREARAALISYVLVLCTYIYLRQNFFNSGFSINIGW